MARFKKDYDVGRGKPPVSGQFPKGKSGNPSGRPRGTKNFATDVEEILNTKVKVQENGKSVKVSSQKATLMRLREKALNGDARSMDRLLTLAEQQSANKEAASTERALNASEDDILARFLESSDTQSQNDEPDRAKHIVDPEHDGGQSDDE